MCVILLAVFILTQQNGIIIIIHKWLIWIIHLEPFAADIS
jgi:hypothetical protein